MPHRRAARWAIEHLALVTLVVVVVSGTVLAIQQQNTSNETDRLAVENSRRITDIARTQRGLVQAQRALVNGRVFACRQVYDGVRKLMKPFNPNPPTDASRKFNRRLQILKRQCEQLRRVSKP